MQRHRKRGVLRMNPITTDIHGIPYIYEKVVYDNRISDYRFCGMQETRPYNFTPLYHSEVTGHTLSMARLEDLIRAEIRVAASIGELLKWKFTIRHLII